MKFHLRRNHDSGADGPWAECAQKILEAPPQQYVMKVRGLQSKKNGKKRFQASSSPKQTEIPENAPQSPSNETASTSAPSCSSFAPSSSASADLYSSLFQRSLSCDQQQQQIQFEKQQKQEQIHLERQYDYPSTNVHAHSVTLPLPARTKSESLKPEVNSSNLSASKNDPSPFTLFEGNSVSQLLQVASEMDLMFTFNARRSGEYCFETNCKNASNSNSTSGKMVVFADFGEKIRVSVRIGPEEIDIEVWTKADWAQFLWAVRAKCQRALLTN